MKLNKLFAVALAVVTLTSCDHDTAEDYPTLLGPVNTASGVTVSLPATFSANENQIPFNLPIEVTGTTNGKVVVTVQTKQLVSVPEGLEPAVEGEHYNVTSYTVNVAPGETEGYIEISPVWIQGELNDDRVFEVSITGVQGATVGNKTCEVTIANIDDPYTAMFGKWKFTSKGCTSSVTNEYTLTIGGPDPSDEDYYGKELYAYGLRGVSYVFLPLNFEYDAEKGEPVISIQVASFATESLINFSGLGQCVVVGMQNPSSPSDPFGDDIPMTYSVAEDGTETFTDATIDPEDEDSMGTPWYLGVMPYPALNTCYGNWGGWVGISLSR